MKQTRTILQILYLLLATVLLAGPARAIDCTKAETKLEKEICADPKLVEADAKLNDAYVKAMSRRKAAEKNALRSSQKEWLTQVSTKKTLSVFEFEKRISELQVSLNDVAKKMAEQIRVGMSEGNTTFFLSEAKNRNAVRVENLDAFATQLKNLIADAELGNKMAAALNFVNGIFEYETFDMNGDGIKDYRIDLQLGSDWCSEPRYLLSSKSHAGKFDVVDFAPPQLCASGGDQTYESYFDTFINSKHYVVARKQQRAGASYEFYDIVGSPITGSRLNILFSDNDIIKSTKSDCATPGCTKDKGKTIKSVSVDAVVTSPHGELVWYTGP